MLALNCKSEKFETILIITVLLLIISPVQNRDVIVGVLSQSEIVKESWTMLTNKDLLPPTTDDIESSNWVVEDAQQKDIIDFDVLFSFIKAYFMQRYPDEQTKITFRKMSFNNQENISDLIQKFRNNRELCDAFVFGFVPHAQGFNEKSGQLFCETLTEMLTTWNKPILSWTCIKNSNSYWTKNVTTSAFLNLLPATEVTAKSAISVLHHFNWRKIAWFTTSWPPSFRLQCDKIENKLLSSNYFIIKYYENFASDILMGGFNNTYYNNSRFYHIWKDVYDTDVSAIVMCLPHGFGTRYQHTTIVDILLRTAYMFDESKAKKLPYMIIDTKGLYNSTILNKTAKVRVRPALKLKRSTQQRNRNNVYSSLKISDVTGIKQLLNSSERVSLTRIVANTRMGNFTKQINMDERKSTTKSLKRRSLNRHINSHAEKENNTPNSTMANVYENAIIISPFLEQNFPIVYKELIEHHSSHIETAYLAYLLDSLYLTMIAASNTTEERGDEPFRDGRKFISTIQNLKILDGFTGPILFDPSSQTRVMNFVVWDIKNIGKEDKLNQAMIIDTSNKATYFKIRKINDITWSSQGEPPRDFCDDDSAYSCLSAQTRLKTHDLLLAVFCGTGTYVMGYVIYTLLRKKKEWQALLRGPNKLFLNDSDIKMASSFQNNRHSDNTSRELSTQGSRRGSLVTIVDNTVTEGDDTIAMLKGDYVYLKCLDVLPIEVKKAARDILRQLRELRHENVCSFYGLYSNQSLHFLVMEYGYRKSLKELLENQDFELNWTFKISLIHDLVKGMKYLHASSIHCHGRLKSRNCIVDGRFVLKVTDYGVNTVRNLMGAGCVPNESTKDLLWTAPELLKDPSLRQIGTQKGDSYSFAIICQEVILREDPYAMLNLNPETLIEKLKKSPPLIRPTVTSDAAPIEMIQIMKQCWQEQPDLRLTFSAIHGEIKRMNRGKKYNIVESMMKQLEDYSCHLEELVNERTAELGEEKKKTEQLLMRMLPPSVAKLLMANKKIIPESFESCTIYFSDICGFTTIAHSSTPMQVVDFLNDLYTCFDAIIENHEVYKVETIGDAYMVSSGIPKVIGDRHAEEAALMALDIMSATTTFRIRHLPDVDLRIRIGMHSGSAVAGVVGLTMPRYCLFGDTINTASRLETTGIRFLAAKVLSDSRDHLNIQPGITILLNTQRIVKVKGRGTMTTWWLLGLDGFTKPLPDPGKINEPSHGLYIDKSTSFVNKSSNNSKHLYDQQSQPILKTKESGFPKNKTYTKQSVTNWVRGGSSYLVTTPLAFVPPLNSSNGDLPQTLQKINSDSLNTNKTTGYHRQMQKRPISTCFCRRKSIAPACTEICTIYKNNHSS